MNMHMCTTALGDFVSLFPLPFFHPLSLQATTEETGDTRMQLLHTCQWSLHSISFRSSWTGQMPGSSSLLHTAPNVSQQGISFKILIENPLLKLIWQSGI